MAHPFMELVANGLAERGVALGIVSNTGRTPGIILRQILERWHDAEQLFWRVLPRALEGAAERDALEVASA